MDIIVSDNRPDFSETRLDGKTVFLGNVVRVETARVGLPDGGESAREVVYHPGAAVIVPLLDNDTVLLEWQFRYALGRHIWEFPAGKLEPDEEPRFAAERELLEETGYRAKRWDTMLSMETSPGFCNEIAHLFLARGLHYEGHPGEKDEFVEAVPVSLEKAFAMVQESVITDAKTIVGLYWLALNKARL